MPRNIKRKMFGVYSLILAPAVIVFGLIWSWLMDVVFAIPILLVLVAVYIWVLFGEITYGPKQIRQITIPDAPEHIINLLELLKTTTIRGDLINVHLVAAFEDQKTFNQSALANHVIEHGKVPLTPQTIKEQYIQKLEKTGIIHLARFPRRKPTGSHHGGSFA
jgi:hypothetical protein